MFLADTDIIKTNNDIFVLVSVSANRYIGLSLVNMDIFCGICFNIHGGNITWLIDDIFQLYINKVRPNVALSKLLQGDLEVEVFILPPYIYQSPSQ